MILSIKSQFALSLAGIFLVVIVVAVMIVTYWTPKFSAASQSIQQNDAAILAIQRQQDNLSDLTRQLSERQGEQDRLNQELWEFTNEDAFFELWDPVAAATNTTIELESVADAVPAELPVSRDATVTITGSLTNVLRALQASPTLTPLVTIREIHFTPGTASSTVTARVAVSTLWYDNTLR